ncbi:hypothetical protein ML462_02810 [Gramella lutea]|uniref:DUF4595 domain-containing protein n=1 Tax=Christiangramia lutea TaxID=1607951 RepID=A0A9X1V151_9FLAO|nr:hypothetical protein [Christiangramia lutea]MCH4822091.1 hypothetical protein [Christiangramia lutea]
MKNIYLILSLFFFIACSETDENPEIQEVDTLPSKIVTSTKNGNFFGSKTMYYDGNQVKNISFSNAQELSAGSVDLMYTDGLLTRINQFDGDGVLFQVFDLEYNSDKRLEEYTVSRNAENWASKKILDYNSENTIEISNYNGDLEEQDEFVGLITYTRDSNNNITKVVTSDYQIVYEYDDKNGIFKNAEARDVLNLLGLLNGPLNRGGMNNAISYTFSNGRVTDHINLEYTYNSNSYPTSVVQMSPEFGEGQKLEFIYN